MVTQPLIATPPTLPQEPKPNVCLYYAPPLPPYLPTSTKQSISGLPFESHHHNAMLLNQRKKNDFIDRLVETSVEIMGSIWQQQEQCTSPYSKMVDYHHPHQEIKVVSTRAYIQEILRRSKTTYSNLQVCLFYLFRVKKSVVMHLNKIEAHGGKKSKDDHMISCGRRMFLASLMLASKFLQDKNYRNRAWSRISGLALHEINTAELAFLKLINYNLYINKTTFDRWYSLLHSYLYREPSVIHHHHHHQLSSSSSSSSLTSSSSSSLSLSSSPCTLCYINSSPAPSPPTPSPLDTSCTLCCNECVLPPQYHHHHHHPSCYYERFSSIKLAYPSPPADEMNSASLVPRHRYKRYNTDDDQDHLPIKRCCIEH
ncbi:cyclin-domain-containing protein [Absidia repens]|uniref:Cyclin-domain-containing protein n=1 Tax=Absidia repens TaxID=90262 RepID=A0A1X2HYH7_9FUNG|nr:cyclin-domain-containing protein [Absidia repens]